MDFIISLAHFCETHGPTTVLYTQLHPVSCDSCFPGPSTPPGTLTLSKNNSFSSENWEYNSPAITPGTSGPLFSPFTSPPTSPRSPSTGHNPYFPNVAGDVKSRRLSMASEADGDVCESCDMVVPKDRVSGLRDSEASGASPRKNHKYRSSSTVLRSVHPVQAYGPGPGSDSDDEEDDRLHPRSSQSRTPSSSHTSPVGSVGSIRASNSIRMPNTHTHKLVYVTKHSPESQTLYSRLRHSCIRTLSGESLPRGSSSGPLSFSDPIAGYTIAYIFRLPDPRARGRRRNYALTAVTRDNSRAMAAFVPVIKAFEAIASYIITMTDRVLERESALLSRAMPAPGRTSTPTTPLMSASVPFDSPKSPITPTKENVKASTSSPTFGQKSNFSDVSSFLSAKRVDPDGYPRMSREVMRAKGLPEIVGREDFFPDLHLRFSGIINNLVTILPR